MSTPATPQAARVWLEQVRADPEGTEDIRKVAAAIAECAPPEIDLGLEKYLAIGGSHGVYADESVSTRRRCHRASSRHHRYPLAR
jgi:hypothetical protein